MSTMHFGLPYVATSPPGNALIHQRYALHWRHLDYGAAKGIEEVSAKEKAETPATSLALCKVHTFGVL